MSSIYSDIKSASKGIGELMPLLLEAREKWKNAKTRREKDLYLDNMSYLNKAIGQLDSYIDQRIFDLKR